MLQQVGISNEVEVEVSEGAIILRPARLYPRTGWEDAFKKAVEIGHMTDDDVFGGTSDAFDQTDWQW